MPYTSDPEWVEPELFLEHRGIKVWCTYKNDELHNGPRTYWFTTNCESTGSYDDSFDVRDLSNWRETKARFASDEESRRIKGILREAIEQGLLDKDGNVHRLCSGCPKILKAGQTVVRVSWATLKNDGTAADIPRCQSFYCCDTCRRGASGRKSEKPCSCRMPKPSRFPAK